MLKIDEPRTEGGYKVVTRKGVYFTQFTFAGLKGSPACSTALTITVFIADCQGKTKK